MTNELQTRLQCVQSIMAQKQLDGLLLTSNVAHLYLTGQVNNGYLYVPANGALQVYLMRQGERILENVTSIRKPELIPDLLQEAGVALPGRWAMEDDVLPAMEWFRLSKLFPMQPQTGVEVMRVARAVKTPEEIRLIEASAAMQTQAYAQFAASYRPGMSDAGWQNEVEYISRKAGHLGFFRGYGMRLESYHMGTLLAGANGGAPSPYDFAMGGAGIGALPVGATGALIEPNTTVMVDISGNANGYLCDMTRIYAIGDIPEKAYQTHAVSIEIMEALANLGKPGVPASALYEKALNIVEKAGLGDCFMGAGQKAKFVGHGVGLEINELPVLSARDLTLLEVGMVIALEPKFYIDGVGSVGNEDTYVVTDSGLHRLTNAPEQITRLEG